MPAPEFDREVCEDSRNLDKLLPLSSVDLSIVVPPQLESSNKDEVFDSLAVVMKKVAKATKDGGTCCLVLTYYINTEEGKLQPVAKDLYQKVLEHPKHSPEWNVVDEIVWVKSYKRSVESLEKAENGIIVRFDQTPFTQINILEKKSSNLESVSRTERVSKLKISVEKRSEMEDSVWFVQPTSKGDHTDRIPEEIVARLVMMYSDEEDFVLDPFAGDGVTGAVAKTLGRHFLCVDKNEGKVKTANNRLKEIMKHL